MKGTCWAGSKVHLQLCALGRLSQAEPWSVFCKSPVGGRAPPSPTRSGWPGSILSVSGSGTLPTPEALCACCFAFGGVGCIATTPVWLQEVQLSQTRSHRILAFWSAFGRCLHPCTTQPDEPRCGAAREGPSLLFLTWVSGGVGSNRELWARRPSIPGCWCLLSSGYWKTACPRIKISAQECKFLNSF